MKRQVRDIVEPTKAELDALVAPFLKRKANGLGIVIGYASPLFPNKYGLYFGGNIYNQQQQEKDLCAETLFQIASITKTFTATLYAHCGIRGRKLADVETPNGPLRIGSQFADIPLETLVNYTSGLPDDDRRVLDYPTPQPYTIPLMLDFLTSTPVTPMSIGAQYSYSNLAFAIMGAVFLHVCGVAFEKLIVTQIFDRLGMNASFFYDLFIDELPLGYIGPSYLPASPGWIPLPAYNAAGGIIASPSDMTKWLLFNMGIQQDSQLSPLLAKLFAPVPRLKTPCYGDEFGFGWFISSRPNFQFIWKDGLHDGFSTYIAFLPSPEPGHVPSRCGVFVLANASGADPGNLEIATQIGYDLLCQMQRIVPPLNKLAYLRSRS